MGAPLGALAIRVLKDHLFAGKRDFIWGTAEYLVISATGNKQPNATKTGVILEVTKKYKLVGVLVQLLPIL